MQSNQLVGLFHATAVNPVTADQHPCRLSALFALLPDVVTLFTTNRRHVVFTPTTHRGFMHVMNLMTRIYNTEATRYSECELRISNDSGGLLYQFILPEYVLAETLKAVINVVEHYLIESEIDFAARVPVRQYWVVKPTDTEIKIVYFTRDQSLAYEARDGADANMYTADGNQCTNGVRFCILVSSQFDCVAINDQTVLSNDDMLLEIEAFKRDGYLVYVSDF
jgi:hypothetical protein